MKHYLLALLAVAVLVVPKPSFAGEGRWEKFAERRIEKFISKLDLSDEQKEKIKDVRGQAKEKLKAAREKKREAFKALATLMKSDTNDEKGIREAFKNLQAVKTDAENAHFETILEIRNVLTPEQREKFHGLVKQRLSRFSDRLQGNGEM